MDRDFEAKKQILIDLLQTLGLAGYYPQSNPVESSRDSSVRESIQAPSSLFQEDFLLKPGEIPAVQDRFHALLKRRLQVEAQRKPPLFPWEKEITDYDAEAVSARATSPVFAETSVWMTQLRNLQLPVPMPESILTELLTRCQAIVTSPLREGAKLVKAVDTLFPGQAQLLNDVAGYVMVSPARSSAAGLQDLAARAGIEFPDHYEEAIDTQQMALSLLAAREIMHTLTFTVSPKQPQQEREWLTELGAFSLRSHYHFGGGTVRLRVDADLPCGGSLQFQGEEFRSLADRDNAGCLSLEIRDFVPDRTYPLEVRLGEQDLLVFAIHPVSEG
ncbi:MAG: hypothetical protein KME43_17590 [Myxacorys chilensis ATA2-1-KO14]|jgi:hypothetical protein|nr:hypothetical protein [Myxacorys chilensis ATA2-1-KO14]